MPKLPAIWIVPDQATFQQASYGTETWTMPVTLAALVKGANPVDAARSSQIFAAKARAIALSCTAGRRQRHKRDGRQQSDVRPTGTQQRGKSRAVLD
jgi:hypothetical protein